MIEASYGLGDLIVSGKINPDEFILSRDPLNITMSNIRNNCLDVGKIKEIAKTCLKVKEIFAYHQDIEWCISDNKLWLLQSRAVTGGLGK